MNYTPGYGARKNKHNRTITIVLIISRVIILVGVWRVFFRQSPSDGPVAVTDVETGSTVRWFVGEKVLLAGDLEENDIFVGTHSHTLTTSDGQVFGVKSSSIDLFSYQGQVELKGEVADFAKELPIIQVSEIVGSSNSGDDLTIGTGKLAGNPDYVYVEDEHLGFDLSAIEGYEIVKEGTEMKLVDTETDTPIFTVSTFECVTGHPLQDCTSLREKFDLLQSDSFTSSQNITLYNLTETNTWIAFNDDNQGYTVRPLTDDAFSNFAGFMQFITPTSIQQFVEKNKSQCKNIDHELTEVTEMSYEEVTTGLLEASINGLGKEGEPLACTMYIRMGTAMTVQSAELTGEMQEIVIADEEVANDDEGIEEPEVEEVEIVDEPSEEDETDQPDDENEAGNDAPSASVTPPSAQVEKPASFNGWLAYNSVRGYTMRFSSQSVAYGGEILEDTSPFNLDITCPYKVQLTHWQKSETLSTNPDIEIYECNGSVTAAEAQGANLQLVGASSDMVFLAKYLTTNLNPIEIYVEVAAEEDAE